MKKQILLTVLIAALLGGTIAAQGNAERGEKPDRDSLSTPTQIETTGVVSVTDEGVFIETSTGTYSLSARGGGLIDLESIDGATVELEGMLTSCADCEDDHDGHIFIASAEVDGTEYEFQTRGMRDGQPRRDGDRSARRDTVRSGGRSPRGQRDSSGDDRGTRAQRPFRGDDLI